MRSTLLFLLALLTCPAVSLAQLKVIMSGGFSAPYRELILQFQREADIKVATTLGPSQGDSPNTIGAQLRKGVRADMVIMSREGLEPLIAEGRIAPGTAVDLARVPLGVAVRSGTPKPNIRTVETFKQALLNAKSIGIQSTSAIYMTTKLFPKLGIAEALAGKLTSAGAAAVAKGESEMAILPISELLHVRGVDFVGALPAEIQHISVFTAAILADSKQPEVCRKLIAFLNSERARPAIQKFGMEPLQRKK